MSQLANEIRSLAGESSTKLWEFSDSNNRWDRIADRFAPISVQHGESEPFSGPAQQRDQELNSTFTVFSLIVTITAKITAKKTVNFFSRHGNRVNTGFSQQGSELTVKQQ